MSEAASAGMPTHGKAVGERVVGCDLAKHKGVCHHGSEEVHSLHLLRPGNKGKRVCITLIGRQQCMRTKGPQRLTFAYMSTGEAPVRRQ